MVEAFFDRYLIIDNRTGLKRNEQRERELYPQSIVRFLAHQLIDVGSTQMHVNANDFYRKFGVERTQTLLDPTGSAEYNTYRSVAARDYSGIVVGSALIGLEDTLVNGDFSQREFIGRIVTAIAKTPWIPPDASWGTGKRDNQEKIKRMRQEAGKDRTLASLLRNPAFRPRALTDFLDEHKVILHPHFWQIVDRYEELGYEMINGEKMAREKRRDLR